MRRGIDLPFHRTFHGPSLAIPLPSHLLFPLPFPLALSTAFLTAFLTAFPLLLTSPLLFPPPLPPPFHRLSFTFTRSPEHTGPGPGAQQVRRADVCTKGNGVQALDTEGLRGPTRAGESGEC